VQVGRVVKRSRTGRLWSSEGDPDIFAAWVPCVRGTPLNRGALKRFVDKAIIVTGSGSGLGRAIALRVGAEGGKVAVADIDGTSASRTVDDIVEAGGEAIAVDVDVSDESAVARMVATTVERFGRLDVLFNNAAALGADVIGRDGNLLDLEVEVWDRTMAVNLRGTMLGCKHGIPEMIRNGGGAIVNTSSASAFRGELRQAAYGTSKAGIVALTKYVATMFGMRNIRCNALAPGHMENPETAEREPAGFRAIAKYVRLLPDGVSPDDVAAVATFLASDEARSVTGQTYVADVGRLAMVPQYAVKQARDAEG
jgi:NAD(P)-dependent dehydrogenase (short-subunit alcohol dehydrogenase family)